MQVDNLNQGQIKVCRKCSKALPLFEFGNTKPHKGDSNNKRARCLSCERAFGREHYLRTIDYQRERSRKKVESGAAREAIRRHEIRRKYGLTTNQLEAMKSQRGNRCDICKKDASGVGGKGLQVDHCHTHGHVRGLLCFRCNMGIGMLFDSPEIMRSAAEYLTRNAR
jgi:hypothetical protein